MTLLHDITPKTLRTRLAFAAGFLLLSFTAVAEQNIKTIKAPISGVDKVQSPRTGFGGAKAETVDKAEQRLPTTLKHRERAVSKEDYKKLGHKSPGVDVKTKALVPVSTNKKQLPKQNNKTLRKQPGKSNSGYNPLKQESKTRTQNHVPQWSDQRNHDPGKTTLKPQISNKQLKNNIKRNHLSIDRPVSAKPGSKDYKISPEPGEIRFGDGRSGRRLPTTTNSKVPSYKAGNRTSTIDTRRGLNSGMDSVPANSNAGMTKTHRNDGKTKPIQNTKTTSKKITTGFTRKPATVTPTKATAAQTDSKIITPDKPVYSGTKNITRSITSKPLIVKALQNSRLIRSQALIVKAQSANTLIRSQMLVVKAVPNKNDSGNQTGILIRSQLLIVKAHLSNTLIRSQPLVVKAQVMNKFIRSQPLIVKGI